MRRPTRTRLSVFISLFFVLTLAPSAGAQVQFDKAEFAARRARLFEQIADGVGVVFAAEPHVHAVKFRQSPDFYYLTGIEEPGAALLLVGKSRQAFVFARKKPSWQVNAEGPGLLDMEKPAEVYGLTQALPMENFLPLLNLNAQGARKLYAPLSAPDSLQLNRGETEVHETGLASSPVYRYTPAVKQAVARLREMHPNLPLADINTLLDKLRWVKTPYEIERMRRSGKIGAEGLKAAIRGTRPGMYEYELEAAARFAQVKLGARGDAFTPIVASGPNTITWHYQSNNRRMQAGDVVLMDYGADFEYYTSDITRTWPVSGTFTPEQEKMYLCILEARAAIIAAMKPGATIKQMQDAAEAVYTRHGFRQQFLELGRYVGHPVGLSVHDVGGQDPATTLQPGVVFNVEPLLEFRDRKIHMRLEDSVLVTETGSENLTAGVPADLQPLYALIRQKAISLE